MNMKADDVRWSRSLRGLLLIIVLSVICFGEVRAESAGGECRPDVPWPLPARDVGNPIHVIEYVVSLSSQYPACESVVRMAITVLQAFESDVSGTATGQREHDFQRFARYWVRVLERNAHMAKQIDALKNVEQQMNQREELRELP